MSVKVPKQWKDWCKRANLRPEYTKRGNPRRQSAWWSLKGRGRRWRIALADHYDYKKHPVETDFCFQGGDRYEDFDRWALSIRYITNIPKTWEEFKEFVLSLDKEK